MILKTYARVFTNDLAVSLPVFRQLIGREPDMHFTFGEWEIVAIGDLLLVAGTDEALAPIRNSYGPLVVDNLEATQQQLVQAGAVITQAISASPTGTMLYARHPDGTHMEYVQWKPEYVRQIIG
jgi:predicted enzyme related to lactoylglutathione lyase